MASHETMLRRIDTGDFRGLFIEELGWSNARGAALRVAVDDETYEVSPVAEYRGIRVWSCPSVPDRRTQRLIDAAVRKEGTERLVIFSDDTHQEWRWPMLGDLQGRGQGRLVAHQHYVGRRTEALLQRLDQTVIGMDESPSVVEVIGRMRRAFDADRVTAAFYGKFAQEAARLSAAINGLTKRGDREWYAALLLNRLMFIYFMQRKGFMDGEVHYLRDRLMRTKNAKGVDKSQGFYSNFLIPLFHEGLGSDVRPLADPVLDRLIGDVPYVKGGIFSVHPLEKKYTIRLPDTAFDAVFALFDSYQWHLDDRPTGQPNEINPDVLGYIFEQFINHKSETGDNSSSSDKGAYYTAEDISGYMTAAALMPVFLDRLHAATSINPWVRVSEDPEQFLWASGLAGIGEPLPEALPADPSDAAWALRPGAPWGHAGESWLEIRARREALQGLVLSARRGAIASSNAAVTANIDLVSLSIAVIDGIDSGDDALAAWNCLSSLKLIDPTCGSGAFLLAALKLLQSLYQAVLDSARRHAKTSSDRALTALLAVVDRHPSEDYFILKHAALNNLYGVDIMAEAAEIARLRLLLALVASVDERDKLEPLPDLDFNVKPGNTLVGAAALSDIEAASGQLFNHESAAGVTSQARTVRDAYHDFRQAQEDGRLHDIPDLRATLSTTLEGVRRAVNEQWHKATSPTVPLTKWVEDFQPFHWFIEFPEVFSDGGFDVVIGNPPYVGASKVRRYTYAGFRLSSAPDIYAPVMERAAQITKPDGRLSMIVPLNLTWGPKFQGLRDLLVERFPAIWVSTYGIIPARLFPGLEIRNTIFVGGPGSAEAEPTIHLSMYRKWKAEARPHLFPTLRYQAVPASTLSVWPKVGHASLLSFAKGSSQTLAKDVSTWPTNHRVGFKKIGGYWLSVFREDPPAMDAKRNLVPQKVVGDLYFRSEEHACAALAIMASRACFMWWVFRGDEFNSPSWVYTTFPVSISDLPVETFAQLAEIGRRLDSRLREPGDHILWTPYARAWQGNFDLNAVRDVTEEADRIIWPLLGIEGGAAQADFETEYANFMKISRERPGTVRGPVPDRDRT